MAQMMQKAQMMKQKMGEMQSKVLELEIQGASGAGMVNVLCNGKGDLKSIKLDPSVVDPEDIEVLEDLILAAVNDAKSKAEKKVADETQKMMSDLGLPPGMGLDLPF